MTVKTEPPTRVLAPEYRGEMQELAPPRLAVGGELVLL